MRASQAPSSDSSPSSSAPTSRTLRFGASNSWRSHTGNSQSRARCASPPNAVSRCAARVASSGIARSAGSSPLQTRCSCAGSWALLSRSIARPRTMLSAAAFENARCLVSSRAVSIASEVSPASRAALSRMRRATVRRAAPCGSSFNQPMAACGSRSSSAQRAARNKAPSCVSWASRPCDCASASFR